MEHLIRLIESPLIWLSHRRSESKPRPQVLTTDFLGHDRDTGNPISLPPEDLTKHCYILGSTGTGKTSLILNLIKQDLVKRHSVVVLDLRGDLVNGAIGLCQAQNIDPGRITLLDLREKVRVQGFNPLAGAGEPYIRALHVLDVIAKEADSWGVQIEESARGALLLLASSNEPLTRIEHVFFDASYRQKLYVGCSDEGVLGFWSRYEDLSADKQQSWALPVLNKVTSLLAVPVLRDILSGQPDLNLGTLLQKKGHVLLISLSVDELHRSSRMLGSLLVSSIAREMMARVNTPEADRNPVRLYVDEFENMASECFEGLIAEGRRFKLSLVLSHQTLSQLQPRLRSVIRNNVGIQILFQCGFEDARLIERELPDEFDANTIRSLAVGEAILMFRDGTARTVKFRGPGAPPSAAELQEYRQRILSRLPNKSNTIIRYLPPGTKPKPNHGADLEDWL